MWYEKQFRDSGNLTTLLQAIRQIATFPIRIMEVCGGQTYALSRYRIEELLPDTVQMIHGPGCPVCVTHEDTISQAIEIARNPQTIFCTFGDMVRVPGTKGSLQQLKAEGKDIRIVYSPLDTLRIASENPEKQVVFFAIGFETTTPLYTLLLQEIVSRKITNLSLLTSLFTIPAAISFLAQDPECKIDGLLAAGHVAQGIDRTINAYRRAVPAQGNKMARQKTERFFTPYDAYWRGLGKIPVSGLRLRPEYEQYEARNRFLCKVKPGIQASACRAGEIMKGKISPEKCPLFGNHCTPDTPLGASMVSSEGACSAFYRYRTN